MNNLYNSTQREAWTSAVEAAKEKALNEQGVEFLYPDTSLFQEACLPLHESVLSANPNLQPIYDMVM